MSTVTAVLKEMGISEHEAARQHALLLASQKVAEFRLDCEAFERKYSVPFDRFEEELQVQREDDFDKEDDHLAWKFASEGAAYWQSKAGQLREA